MFFMRIKHLLLKIYSNLSRPSFSFRNRLFIERNEKHARISGMLSNTFRASKWSNLSMNNISSRFNNLNSSTWTRPLYVLGALVLAYYLMDFIIGFSAINFLFANTWVQLDSAFQIVTQWLMLKWILIGQFVINWYQSTVMKLFTNRASSTTKTTNQSFQSLQSDQSETDTKDVVPFGKDQQTLFLYNLTNPSAWAAKRVELEKVFNYCLKRGIYEPYAIFLQSLYRLTNLMGTQDLSLTGASVVRHLKRMIPGLNTSRRFSLSMFQKSEGLEPSSEIRLQLESELNRFVNRGRELEATGPSLRLYHRILNDQLISYFEEGSLGYRAAITPSEPFTFSSSTEIQQLSQRNDTTDLLPLEHSARVSNTFVEHQRRLYRFSLLHRSILQNSHKLTNAKSLITSGFYDSSLTASNLWVSEFFNRSFDNNDAITHTVKHLLKQTSGFNGLTTPQTSFLSTYSNLSTPALSLNTLNLFEKSYFWNIKRFYNFNTSHSMIQVLGLDRTFNKAAGDSLTPSHRATLDVLQSHGLKSYSLTNPGFTHQLVTRGGNISESTDLYSKSVYTQSDNTPLFNPTNANIMHDLLASKDASEVRTRYFPFFTDYSQYLTTSIEDLTSLKDLNDVTDACKANDPTSSSNIFINDRILLKDLILLTRTK